MNIPFFISWHQHSLPKKHLMSVHDPAFLRHSVQAHDLISHSRADRRISRPSVLEGDHVTVCAWERLGCQPLLRLAAHLDFYWVSCKCALVSIWVLAYEWPRECRRIKRRDSRSVHFVGGPERLLLSVRVVGPLICLCQVQLG